MDIREMRNEIEELMQLVEGWEQNGESIPIESDVALMKLSRLYEGIRFNLKHSTATAPTPLESYPKQSEILSDEDVAKSEEDESLEQSEESTFAIDLDDIVLISPSIQEEPDPDPELDPEPEPEPEPEEPKPSTPKDNVLFDIEPLQPKQSRRRRSVLMSLYNDSDATPMPRKVVDSVEPKPLRSSTVVSLIEEVEERREAAEDINEPVVAQSVDKPILTLADTLTSSVETVADRLSVEASHPIVSDRLAYNSFKGLGINERYLLARDLFGDDSQLCNQTLETIDAFEDYNDVMIFIAENFSWNPDVEGTKLLLSILENKFNIR